MKAQSLWPKHDYAYIESRGKEQRWSSQVKRVRVVRTFKSVQYGKKNATTFAEVKLLDYEGEPTSDITRDVRAYDIVDFWDDFEGEFHDSIQAKIDYERRQRELRESREREQTEITNAIQRLNPLFTNPQVSINIYSSQVTIAIPTQLIKEKNDQYLQTVRG